LPQRMALFIDYQNVYKGARRCFSQPGAPHMDGQIIPLRLGLKLRDRGQNERQLTTVRIYRGMPSSAHDPKGFGACRRQVAQWDKGALVVPITRPLNYRDPVRPKEKGIDVRIAIDLVMMAMRNDFDVGVLFSGDTDLVPAMEAVAAIKGVSAIEVAAWQPSSPNDHAIRLRLPNTHVQCHYLDERDYQHVHDTTDYTR
jgi:uncharacterized LabA/DUF88 family protein